MTIIEIKNKIALSLNGMVNDNSLLTDEIEDSLYEKFSIKELKYDKTKSSKHIGKIQITAHNASQMNVPNGFVFTNGQETEYIDFSYGITGPSSLIPHAFPQYFLATNRLYNNDRNSSIKCIVYREYCNSPIDGNTELIKQLNEIGIEKKVIIEKRIEEFNQSNASINAEIKTIIPILLNVEREKRKKKKFTNDNINPF